MLITDVSVVLEPDVMVSPRRWREGLPMRAPLQRSGYLRIRTDDGVEGFAPVARPELMKSSVEDYLRSELVGGDPLARAYYWRRIWQINRVEYYPVNLVGAVDVALWDIAGKTVGLPVHKLLGTFRNEIPAYASTTTFESIEEYLDVADQCVEMGYVGVKLHAWDDARRNARLVTALRDHVGPDLPLMFDGSAAFDLPDAIYLGSALSDAGYLWYEEPMQEYSISSYRRLSERVGVPLLVAEVTEGAHWNTADFIESCAVTYVRTSATFKGGITGAMMIANLADAFGMRAEVHGGGFDNEHLCMAIANTTYYESLVTSTNVKQDPRLTPRQTLLAPTAPGIGWTPTPPE
jgi:L-alanine-DL-glutamate epimerase-like enolase superfamily enzyme